ncbi:MAG: hypothetical protein F4039_08965 [Gammaproteobacteria bacterium]|nr:hypothetical protein [Gammaproteobacteria bacterium]MYK44200.1 hypothetical protein [Gammaproteobacteria bacterium]
MSILTWGGDNNSIHCSIRKNEIQTAQRSIGEVFQFLSNLEVIANEYPFLQQLIDKEMGRNGLGAATGYAEIVQEFLSVQKWKQGG